MRDLPGLGLIADDCVVLFADFETFYSQTYSLTKMSPAEYILDPLFEAICLGVASLTSEPFLVDGPDIQSFVDDLKACDRNIVFVSHNAQFDAAILSWRYGFSPDMIVDTIAMSRTVLGPKLRSHSLASVAEYFSLPSKGTVIKDVKGMTRADIKACGLWGQMREYCLHDTYLCCELYKRLLPCMPDDELQLHDILTRCTTEPLLRVDRVMLETHLQKVLQQKAECLAAVEQLGIGKPDLMSNPKFADVLRSIGIIPPMKVSAQTKQETYAFSKTDKEFTDLLEHPNPLVKTVVEARLGIKSTIEETRTRRFIAIANLDFPNLGSCVMPMPVIIGAAHTHRVGGGWDLNVQNMGRNSKLRDAIHAGDGYLLLVADAKQIEARFTAWFCGETDLIKQFRAGDDVYCKFASEIFGMEITKDNPTERFVGKTAILQLGYASGWAKFQRTIEMLSKQSGTPLVLSDASAQGIVDKYRQTYKSIKKMWGTLDSMLLSMNGLPERGEEGKIGTTLGCVTFYKQQMVGPTLLPIHFPYLEKREAWAMNDKDEYVMTDDSWWFRDGRFDRRTYGASLLETIAQHCSRCIVMGAAVRLREPMARMGARLVHTAHDELVYRVPDYNVETATIWAKVEMNRPPHWAKDLPLDCDIGVAYRYGDAK